MRGTIGKSMPNLNRATGLHHLVTWQENRLNAAKSSELSAESGDLDFNIDIVIFKTLVKIFKVQLAKKRHL